ncbi:MAG: hypothetical protein J7M38_12410, partial [Armatimonadetes bacterium]|nr:hypothetical protein [Armatimonadota bacterium]
MSRVGVTAMIVVFACGVAVAAPDDWWDGRWHYRALVTERPIGPQIEMAGNFTTLLAGRGTFAPESVRVVCVTAGGPVVAPARWAALPGYDAQSAAVGTISARLGGTGHVYVYFDTTDAGPFGPGPMLAPGMRGNELLVDGGFETLGTQL